MPVRPRTLRFKPLSLRGLQMARPWLWQRQRNRGAKRCAAFGTTCIADGSKRARKRLPTPVRANPHPHAGAVTIRCMYTAWVRRTHTRQQLTAIPPSDVHTDTTQSSKTLERDDTGPDLSNTDDGSRRRLVSCTTTSKHDAVSSGGGRSTVSDVSCRQPMNTCRDRSRSTRAMSTLQNR